MKVLLHTGFKYDINGGVSKVILNISKELKERGIDTELLYGFGSPNRHQNYMTNLGILKYSYILPVLSFNKAVSGKKYDIVHSHSPEMGFDSAVARVLFKGRYRILLTLHGLDKILHNELIKEIRLGREKFNIKRQIFYKNTISKAQTTLKLSDKLTAVSHSVSRDIQKLYGFTSSTIHNGVDIGEFFPTETGFRENHGLDEDNKLALFVGTCTWRKGLRYLIEAFKEIKDGSYLVVIGVDKKRITSAFGSIPNNVIPLGFVGKSELIDAYRAADIFCMPSLYEPFGLTYLESMGCGTPVMATTDSGIGEIVDDDTGFLVSSRSPNDIYNVITKVSKNKLHKMRFKCRSVAKKMSWKRIAIKYERQYDSLL